MLTNIDVTITNDLLLGCGVGITRRLDEGELIDEIRVSIQSETGGVVSFVLDESQAKSLAVKLRNNVNKLEEGKDD